MSNVEVQMHGHDRSVGLFNCVARFLDFARNDRSECAFCREASCGLRKQELGLRSEWRAESPPNKFVLLCEAREGGTQVWL